MSTPNAPEWAAENERSRAEEELRRANETLEERVAARTEELQRQREWLRVTLRSIGDALIATDAAGRVSFLNPVAEALTGWSPQEALGQPVQSMFQIIDETTRVPGEDIIGRVLREGVVIKLANNTCLLTRDGREIPIEDSAAPIKDSDGKVVGAVLVFHDVTPKRRAQQALRESDLRLRRSQEIAHLGSWELDLAQDRLTWSDEVYRIFGLQPQEFGATYEAFLERVHPDDRHKVDDAYSSSLRENRATYEVEHRVVRKGTGEVRVVQEKCEHFRNAAGQVIRSVGMVQDITERARAEDAVGRSEERLRLALNATNLGTWDFNPVTGVLAWDARCKELFGLPPEFEVNYDTFLAGLHPEDRERANHVVQRTFDPTGGGFFDIEYRTVGLRDGGVLRWVRATGRASFNDSGQAIRFIGTVQDISERKQAEEALARQREELQLILDSAPALIFYKDRENRFLRVNRAFADSMGAPKEQLEGRSLFDLYPREQAEAYWRDDQEVLASGQPKLNIVEPMHTAAGDRWVQTGKVPCRDAQGNLTGVIGFALDITERQQAEAALRESVARAKVAEAVQVERQRLQEVLNLLPAYVVLLSPDYRVPFANRFFEERFGKSKGKRCYEYLFNRSEPCEVCETFKVLKTRTPLRWEWTGPDGRNYDIHDFPFTDVDGSPLIMEVGLDITERKQAEATLAKHRDHLEELVKERTGELRASETRYRSLFEHMTEGFALHEIITDERGEPCDYRFLEVNPAFERLTGLPPGGLVGKRVREVMPATEKSWIQSYGKVALTGEPMHFEDFSSALNRWYEVFAYQPAPSQFAVVFADITTRKQAERDLFNANQRLEALMRAVPVGVSFSDDSTCQRITGNPAALAQFEVAAADNLSASAPDDVAPGRQVRFFREGRPITDAELPLQRAVAENKVIPPMELEVHLPNGRRWFAEASGAPVHGSQGEVVGGLAVTVDITERKRAEEVLRKNEALALSEKEFRLLAEAMPQIVWATRADGWNTYFNQQWVDYTGLTLEESYGHGWNKPFHPDDQQRAWDAWQNAVTNRANYALECRLRRADGTYRWWLVRGVPVLDEKGIILKWFGTCTDINDLKEAEKALREAGEERLRLVLEATSMGTFEVDLRTGEGRWNTVEFELLGLNPGDAPSVPATFFRYLHPDDAARVQAQWAEATRTGILNTEFRIVRADGQVRWLAGLGRFAYAGKPDDSVPGGKPEPVRFLGVNFDITERKQMEEALRESESRYRAIGESIDYGVWVCAPDGRNLYASPSFLKLVGLTQEQCSNFGWGDVLHPDDTARTIAAWKECVRTGGKWDIEHRFRGVDGKYHPVLARGVPVRNDRGEIVCWVGINLDIGRLKEAEEETRKRAEELRATNEELTRFNEAMVGRELRMIELKQEIDAICAQFGQPRRYGPLTDEEAQPGQ